MAYCWGFHFKSLIPKQAFSTPWLSVSISSQRILLTSVKGCINSLVLLYYYKIIVILPSKINSHIEWPPISLLASWATLLLSWIYSVTLDKSWQHFPNDSFTVHQNSFRQFCQSRFTQIIFFKHVFQFFQYFFKVSNKGQLSLATQL